MTSTATNARVLSYPQSQRPRSNWPRLPIEDQPRERLLRAGGTALSDAELVSLLLQAGSGRQAIELAHDVLAKAGGLAGLLRARERDVQVPGVGPARSAVVLAAVELARRVARIRMPRRDLLERPDAVASYLGLRYAQEDQEVMGALYLDVRNRLIGEGDIFRGTLSRAAVEPRTILKVGLLHSASGFILFHTHPSGDPAPSAEDLSFTRRMSEAGDLLGVKLLDHIILGSAGRWVSLGRRGAW